MRKSVLLIFLLLLGLPRFIDSVKTTNHHKSHFHRKLDVDAETAEAGGEGETEGDGEIGEEGDDVEVSFDMQNESEKLQNFRKVSRDIDVYEEEYAECLKEIPDEEFTQEARDGCVGQNFIKVVLDVKYITLKVMAKLDTKLRQLYIEECYKPAGVIEEFAIGCDVFEKDVLDMMWNALEFVELTEINKEKYLFEYGKVPADVFTGISTLLEVISEEFFSLLEEIDSHKDIMILKLKNLIDDRLAQIEEKSQESEAFVPPPEDGATIIEHTVGIEETVAQPEEDVYPQEQQIAEEGETIAQTEEIPIAQGVDATKRTLKQRQGIQARPVMIRKAPQYVLPKTNIQQKVQRNKDFKRQMVNRVDDKLRMASQMKFKNVHVPKYQNRPFK